MKIINCFFILIFLISSCSNESEQTLKVSDKFKLDEKEKERVLTNAKKYLNYKGYTNFYAIGIAEKTIVKKDQLYRGIIFLGNSHKYAEYFHLEEPLKLRMFFCDGDPRIPDADFIEVKEFVGDTGIVSFKAEVNNFEGKDTIKKSWGGLIKAPLPNGIDTSFLLIHDYYVIK